MSSKWNGVGASTYVPRRSQASVSALDSIQCHGEEHVKEVRCRCARAGIQIEHAHVIRPTHQDIMTSICESDSEVASLCPISTEGCLLYQLITLVASAKCRACQVLRLREKMARGRTTSAGGLSVGLPKPPSLSTSVTISYSTTPTFMRYDSLIIYLCHVYPSFIIFFLIAYLLSLRLCLISRKQASPLSPVL